MRMRPRDPFTVAVLFVVYVLPLAGAVALLLAVDLPQLAVALLGVEVMVTVAVLLAVRTPKGRGRTRAGEPPQCQGRLAGSGHDDDDRAGSRP